MIGRFLMLYAILSPLTEGGLYLSSNRRHDQQQQPRLPSCISCTCDVNACVNRCVVQTIMLLKVPASENITEEIFNRSINLH